MENLPRDERLRGRERIGQIFREGSGGTAGKMAARALANTDGCTRMAAVAGKKLGGAVARNRMRRRIRAAYRQQKDSLPKGWDVVLMARPGLLEATWQDVMRDVATAMKRALQPDAFPGPRPPRRKK